MSSFHFSPRPNRAAEIAWLPWGDEPFERARSEGKPLLLAISAVWCHWCHVMDETTYSDERVIELVNKRFVPVRVDNDQRPDVNARYNMGGWPTTVVLSEEGEVLQGGTYVPADQMASLLEAIERIYADPNAKLELAKRIAQGRAERASRAGSAAAPPAAPQGELVDRIFERISVEYDDEYAGFGDEPKFPQTGVLHFLLDLCARGENPRAREMVRDTLRAMSAGGMYDRVWGGFFRYSTTRDWTVPHFEKMLEDLGGLVLACARAGAMFDDRRLRDVAVDTVRYMDEYLWQPDAGGYGGSQDADEEFYALDAAERAKRPRPYVDPIVYTAWNMETARALVLSSALLADSVDQARAWSERGLAVMERLWTTALVDGLFCRYRADNGPRVRGLLVDQTWAAMAALSAFEATGDARWLERCGALIDSCEPLYDERAGGYLDRLRDEAAPGKLAEPHVPSEENALMARVLTRFARMTGETERAQRATAILGRLAPTARRLGRFAAGIGSALLEHARPPYEVAVTGPAADERMRALREAAIARPTPALIVNSLDPTRDARRAAALGHDFAEIPLAYVCSTQACFARAATPEELAAALARGPE